MIFDVNNLFFHTGTAFAFTAGEFVSLVGMTESGQASSNINITNARDMGIGDYSPPKVALEIGTAITTANTTTTFQFRFQGSTDSTNWTTYVQSDWLTTASLTASSQVFMIDVPPVPPGVSNPQYYRIFMDLDNTGGAHAISSGTIIGGIVLQRDNAYPPTYASGFTVV